MQRAAAVTFLVAAGVAQAHPGHVVGSLWHLLTEPDHLAMLVLPWVVAAALVYAWRRAKQARRNN